MKIRIRKDAYEYYVQSRTDHKGNYKGSAKWEDRLLKIAGTLIEVNTKELFKYEYNTLPIPGVTKEGIRIPEDYVDEVIDDVRPGKARCDFCNEVSESCEKCTSCGRSDYLDCF